MLRAPKGISKNISIYNSVTISKEPRDSDYEFIRKLGLKPVISDDFIPNGWLHIKGSIEAHIDGYGMCFVYCSSGVGTVYVESEYDHTVEHATLISNTFTIFNDHIKHSFTSHTSHTNILVCGISNRAYNPKNKDMFIDAKYIKLTKS